MNKNFRDRLKKRSAEYSLLNWKGESQFELAFRQGAEWGYDQGVNDSTTIVQVHAEGGNIDNYGILCDRLDNLFIDEKVMVALYEEIMKKHENLFKKLAKSEEEDRKSSCVVCFNLKCTCKPRE